MRRILIVDDERIIREGIAKTIQLQFKNKLDVLTAESGQIALNTFHANGNAIDILLTDIVMPEMNGIELIKQCREENIKSEFLILSSYDEFRYAQEAIRNGVSEYILKPCKVDELTRVINKILDTLDKSNSQNTNDNEIDYLRLSPPVQKTIEYLNYHLDDSSLSLLKITSEVVFINSDYLGKLFKKETGIKFSSYLLNKRIAKAKELLEITNLSVVEIADKTGFQNNPSYFSHLFKQETGKTPSDYRKTSVF